MPRKLLSHVFTLLAFFAIADAQAAWQWQSTGAVVQDGDPRSCCGGIVVPNPSGLAVGDDVILVLSYRSGQASTWPTPSGWTLLASNTELAAFCRKADSALVSAGSLQAYGPAAGNSMGVMLRFTGGPTNCAPHATNIKTNSGSVQDVTTDTLTITQPNNLVLVVGLFNWSGGSSGVNSYPGGATNRVSMGSSFVNNQLSLLVGSLVQSTATNIPAGMIDMVTTNTAVSKSMVISIPAGTTDPTAAPTGVTVTPTGTASPSTTLRVTWNTAANAHHYRVRYKRAVDSTYTLISTQLTGLTTDIDGLSPMTTYDVQVGSANDSESVLIWPSIAAQGTTQSISTSAINWHPGHYVALTPIVYTTSAEYAWDQHLGPMNAICNLPEWKGFQLYIVWGAYEGATAGDYTAGRAIIQKYLDKARDCNKYLIVNFLYALYGTTSQTLLAPAYIRDDAQYGITLGDVGNKVFIRVWQQATMDRFIAAMQDLGEQFGDDERFEMIYWWETAIAVNAGKDGFSEEALKTQIQRWLIATRTAMPKQQVRLGMNYGLSDSRFSELLVTCLQISCTLGGPNTNANAIFPPNQLYAGLGRDASGAWTITTGMTDYRGTLPFVSGIEDRGDMVGCGTPSGCFNGANDGYTTSSGVTARAVRPSYFTWTYSTNIESLAGWGGTNPWRDGIRPFVETTIDGAINYTTCPTAFAGCVTN